MDTCVDTEHFLHTVIQIRGEIEHGLVTGKKTQIYSKPLGKLKYFECNVIAAVCVACTSPAGEAKLKVTGYS